MNESKTVLYVGSFGIKYGPLGEIRVAPLVELTDLCQMLWCPCGWSAEYDPVLDTPTTLARANEHAGTHTAHERARLSGDPAPEFRDPTPEEDERTARTIADERMLPSCVGHYSCMVKAILAGITHERKRTVTP